MDEELFLMFLEMESTPGADAQQIVKMTISDLDCNINLADKQQQGLRALTTTLEGLVIQQHHMLQRNFLKRSQFCLKSSSHQH